jgi:hypothetical protein
MSHTSAFKTPEGEAAYLAAYDAAMKLWPVSYEEIEIPSRFGMTHVVASGPKDAPPLVLLHGYWGTLTMWALNIADFSKDYRVYAIDIMGQPSKSIPDEPVRNAADYVAWLTAILDGVHLGRVSGGHVLRRMVGAQLRRRRTGACSQARASISCRERPSDCETIQSARDADVVVADTSHDELVHALTGDKR